MSRTLADSRDGSQPVVDLFYNRLTALAGSRIVRDMRYQISDCYEGESEQHANGTGCVVVYVSAPRELTGQVYEVTVTVEWVDRLSRWFDDGEMQVGVRVVDSDAQPVPHDITPETHEALERVAVSFAERVVSKWKDPRS